MELIYKCENCSNQAICKFSEEMILLGEKYQNQIEAVVAHCEYFSSDNIIIKNIAKFDAPKTNYKTALDILGLGQESKKKKIKPVVAVNGTLCNCCNQILPPELFQGDTCSVCGNKICVNCAYVVDKKILCEKCF